MEASCKWRSLPQSPSFKNLTEPGYGRPREQQRPALQDLARAHIESFNYAVGDGLQRAIQAIPPLEFLFKKQRVTLSIVGASISSPMVPQGTVCKAMKIYPAECRSRRSTYRGKLTVDVSWSLDGVPKGVIKQALGNIPIMVKSKLCNLHGLPPKGLVEHHEEEEEMGGYFIVNGVERVIRMIIMPRRNFPHAMIRPKWKSRGPGYTEYGVSMRCVKDEHTAVNMTLHYLESGTVMLNFIYHKELFFLPLGFVLKALVSFSDFQIFQELIKGKEDDTFYKNCVSQMLRLVAEDNCITQKQVLNFLGQRFRVKLFRPDWYSSEQVGEFLLEQCICIHLKSKMEKFYLLCLMTRKLFTLAKEGCMEENPDSLMNQEALTSGELLLMFLRVQFSVLSLSQKDTSICQQFETVLHVLELSSSIDMT